MFGVVDDPHGLDNQKYQTYTKCFKPPCWGLKAFGVCLVFLIVKSMWVIYHTKHVDVPSSKHSYH